MNGNNISLGLYKSQQKLLEAVAPNVHIPETSKVVEINTGIMNEGEENQRYWANLTVVDAELYDKFESIGAEEHCPTFKVKLKGYNGQNLSTLQDSEIRFNRFEVVFLLDKFKQPIGLGLSVELANMSVI